VTQRKLWRTVKEWVPHEWATKKAAWLRVYAALSENVELTQRDLRADLLAKRLVGAARVIAPDGSERCIIFKPAFWEPVELTFAWLMTGCEKYVSEGEKWHFFVRRRELDRFYPVTAASEQPTAPAAQPAYDDAQPTPQRRKPGPPPNYDWQTHVMREVIKRLRAGEKFPTAPAMLQWCEDEWDWQPDIRQMQRLLRDL
jgi:hypothetical protein